MPDPRKPDRGWQLYVDDMIGCMRKIQSYTKQMDKTAFISNPVVYDATLRNLELIGEAATHIPEDIRDAHPEIPWRTVIAARNRIIHGYLGIDDSLIWHMIESSIPKLLPVLEDLQSS